MVQTDAAAVRKLFEAIVAARAALSVADAGRDARLEDVDAALARLRTKLPHDVGGNDTTRQWESLAPGERADLAARLDGLDELVVGVEDVPPDPRVVLPLAVFAIAGTLLILAFIGARWASALGAEAEDRVTPAREELSAATLARSAAEEVERAAIVELHGAESAEPLEQTAVDAARRALDAARAALAPARASERRENDEFQAALAARRAEHPSEGEVLWMVLLMGALGGFVHLIGSLAGYVGNRKFRSHWTLFYLIMPLRGATLAPVVYLLLRVGVLAPGGAAGPETQSLNLVGVYAFAALTGLFAQKATDKLREVFETLFRTERSDRDSLSGDGS